MRLAGVGGSGLTTYLLERGERLVEVDRPKRPARDEPPGRSGKFAVIIDEAHSSQGGEAAKALRQALGSAARELEAASEAEGNEGGDEFDVSGGSGAPGGAGQAGAPGVAKLSRWRWPRGRGFDFTLPHDIGGSPTKQAGWRFASNVRGCSSMAGPTRDAVPAGVATKQQDSTSSCPTSRRRVARCCSTTRDGDGRSGGRLSANRPPTG